MSQLTVASVTDASPSNININIMLWADGISVPPGARERPVPPREIKNAPPLVDDGNLVVKGAHGSEGRTPSTPTSTRTSRGKR